MTFIIKLQVTDYEVVVLWSDLRKSRSFPGLWGWRNPGSRAKRRRTGRGQKSPATKASENCGARASVVTKDDHPVISYNFKIGLRSNQGHSVKRYTIQ